MHNIQSGAVLYYMHVIIFLNQPFYGFDGLLNKCEQQKSIYFVVESRRLESEHSQKNKNENTEILRTLITIIRGVPGNQDGRQHYQSDSQPVAKSTDNHKFKYGLFLSFPSFLPSFMFTIILTTYFSLEENANHMLEKFVLSTFRLVK